MIVGHKQVLPSVIVVVKKTSAPSKVLPGREGNARREGHISEQSVSQVSIERVVVIRKMSHEKVEMTVVIEASESNSHSSLGYIHKLNLGQR